jgi:uncharacterized surface anchored protein
VAFDADHDGTFETPVADITTAASPTELGQLLPGDYQVTERAPPSGYVLPTDAAVVVRVPPAGRVDAVIDDMRVPPPPPPSTTTTTARVAAAAPQTTTTTSQPTTTSSTSTTSTSTSTSTTSTTEPVPPTSSPPPAEARLPLTGGDVRSVVSLALALVAGGALLVARAGMGRRLARGP